MSEDTITSRLLEARNADRRSRRAQVARDDAIRAAKAAGASYAQIAEAVGMTRAGVQGVVRRGKTPAEA